MHYGNLKKYDIANGEGVRVTLFVSGCTNHCKGCFQKETWDFDFGQIYDKKVEGEILEALNKPYIKGLTLLGGEPFEEENQKVLTRLLRRVKEELPQKDIWAYTGFILDQDLLKYGKRHYEVTDEMLSYIDVLVDGPFIEDKKDISLAFRGSKNQRIIDLKRTLQDERIHLYLE